MTRTHIKLKPGERYGGPFSVQRNSYSVLQRNSYNLSLNGELKPTASCYQVDIDQLEFKCRLFAMNCAISKIRLEFHNQVHVMNSLTCTGFLNSFIF